VTEPDVQALIARIEALESALAQNEALDSVRQLRQRYCRYVDAKRWDELESILTADYQHFSSNTVGEPASLVATSGNAFRRRLEELTAGASTVHVCSMPEITMTSATTATGLWSMTDIVSHPTRPGMRFSGRGHYQDVYRRGDDQVWRIAVTRLTRQRLDPLAVRETDHAPTLPTTEDLR
jgi:hypothetical protein